MSIVEPLLTKHMLANIATQLGAMESDLPELRKRGLKVEEVEEKWRKCQVCVCVCVCVCENCEGWWLCGSLIPRLLCENLGMRLVMWLS